MVYSAIETTCFDLYWPSSGFYNIEEESINAVKTVKTIINKTSTKRNILTIKQNAPGSRSGYGLISTPVV